MNDSELYFNGSFSPGWLETSTIPETTPLENNTQPRFKSLETLKAEMEEIKEHLQDVRERQWNLEKRANFLKAGLEKE